MSKEKYNVSTVIKKKKSHSLSCHEDLFMETNFFWKVVVEQYRKL